MNATTKCQHALVFTTLSLIFLIVVLVAFLAPMTGSDEFIRPVTRVVIPVDTTTTRAPWTTPKHGFATATGDKISNPQKYEAVAVVGPGYQTGTRGKRSSQSAKAQGDGQKMHGTIKTGRMNSSDGPGMQISGQVKGLTPGGVYGVTMHQYGDTTKGCNALGPGMKMRSGSMHHRMANNMNHSKNSDQSQEERGKNQGFERKNQDSGSRNQTPSAFDVPYVIPGKDYSGKDTEYYGTDPNGSFNKMNPVMSSGRGTFDYQSNRSNSYITGSNVNFLPVQTAAKQTHGQEKSSDSASDGNSSWSKGHNSGFSNRNWNNGDANSGNNYQPRNEMAEMKSEYSNSGNSAPWSHTNQEKMEEESNQNDMGRNSRGKRSIRSTNYDSYEKMNPEMSNDEDLTNDYRDYNGTLVGTFMANNTGCGEFVFFVLTGVADACGDVALIYGRSVAIRPIYGTYDDSDLNEDVTSRKKRHASVVDTTTEESQKAGKDWQGASNEGEMDGMGRDGSKTGSGRGQRQRGGFTSPSQMKKFGMGPGMKLGMPESCGVFARM